MRPGPRLGTRRSARLAGRRLGPPVLSVLPLALLVAGCTGTGTTASGTSTPATPTGGSAVTTTTTTGAAAPSDPGAAWADRVCGEVVKIAEAQTAEPPNLANSDTAQTMRDFNRYVQANVDAAGRAITNLRGMGPSPIAGTDQAMSTLLDGLDSLKRSYQSVKDALGAVSGNDQQAAQAAVLQAFTGISLGGEQLRQAVDSFESNQALADAAKQAPNCQKLSTSVVPTTTTTS